MKPDDAVTAVEAVLSKALAERAIGRRFPPTVTQMAEMAVAAVRAVDGRPDDPGQAA